MNKSSNQKTVWIVYLINTERTVGESSLFDMKHQAHRWFAQQSTPNWNGYILEQTYELADEG